jgi:DNA-binding NtrC family response regulator
MPKLAGDALAREVRETRPDLPFMLISSQAGFLTATDLFVSILSKPINYEELLGAVADIVR